MFYLADRTQSAGIGKPRLPANRYEQTKIMIILGTNNQSVELKIGNYEFPNSYDNEYDANWLLIYLNVKSEMGNWQTIDPSLLTWEFQKIIDWFISLSENQAGEKLLEFIEPNISFELLNNTISPRKRIKIMFDLESKPKSAKEGVDYFVEFEADNTELKMIAQGLKNELAKYPLRN